MCRSIVLIILLLSVTAWGQSWYFYDENGDPIVYEAFDDLVAVRVDPDAYLGSAQAFAFDHPELVDTTVYQFLGNETFLFPIEPGFTLSQATNLLWFDENVWMVNPTLKGRLNDTLWINNTLIAVVSQSALQSQVDSIQASFGLTLRETIDDSLRIHLLEREPVYPHDILRLARELYETGVYYSVEPNIGFRLIASSADPYYTHQWQFRNTGQEGGTAGVDVDWELARLYDEPNFLPPYVAVIDQGFQLSHEDLQDQAYLLQYDAAGFQSAVEKPDSNAFNDCFGNAENCWHGTAVLGLLDATLDNELGITGFENRPIVIPIKVGDFFGNSTVAAFGRALAWVSSRHGPVSANVISMSVNNTTWRTPANDLELYSIYKSGKVIVASVSNSGEVLYPATSPYVLAVGMTDRWDNPVGGGIGPELDVIAPGVDIWSLDLMGDYGKSSIASHPCDENLNYVCGESGTSFAAPIVAGIAIKMLIAEPNLIGINQDQDSAELIYEVIRRSSERERYGGGSERVNDIVGWGRVNAEHAISSIRRGDANNDGLVNISDAVYVMAYIFQGGPIPVPRKAQGDANGDGTVNISDAAYLIGYVYAGGPPPPIRYSYF